MPYALLVADTVRDGGGVRGISSLLILEDIMEKIREIKGLDQIPRPCEYFDLIGGTSTGGYCYPSISPTLLTMCVGLLRSCSDG